MRLNVNPTRMELTRLKKRLQVAVRGHKLLKDKQDELMRKFIDLVKKNNEMRIQMESTISDSLKKFMMAKAVMGSEIFEEAVMMPSQRISLEISTKNMMGVAVPEMKFKSEGSSTYPYGYAETSGEMDSAVDSLYEALSFLLELTGVEKSCQLMADEIEKTRRRVNALEYIMIPQFQETIKYITMKLDENERGNLTRLMKVKSMMNEAHQ